MIKKAIKIAEEAGEILMKYYGEDHKVGAKSDDILDIVTDADLEADKLIRKRLEQEFPGDQILTEESESNITDFSGRLWIIDPLDGTYQFHHKIPKWSILIGLCIDGKPVLGVQYIPEKDELFYGEKGKGAFLRKNGKIKRICVSKTDSLGDSVLISMADPKIRVLDKLLGSLDVKKRWPLSNFGVAYLAEGKADIYVHPSFTIKKWDCCAIHIIVEEAGGKVTDIYGNDIDYKGKTNAMENSIVFSNKACHDELIKETSKFKK